VLSKGRITDDLIGGNEDADVMLPITEIKAEGEPAADSGRGVGSGGHDDRGNKWSTTNDQS
jgi:hypothetical protein